MDVDTSEVASGIDRDVPVIFKTWQNKESLAFCHPKYFFYSIALLIDELVPLINLWLKKRAKPENKVQRSVFEKLQTVVPLFINVN